MLNGAKQDVEELKSRMEERRLRARLGKVAAALGGSPQVLPSRPAVPVAAFTAWRGLGSREIPVWAWVPGDGGQQDCRALTSQGCHLPPGSMVFISRFSQPWVETIQGEHKSQKVTKSKT